MLTLSSLLKLGLTFAVLAFSEYQFISMSLFIIFAKWLSITFAGSLMNFTGIPSKHVALWEFN